jgi:hypothetical protein
VGKGGGGEDGGGEEGNQGAPFEPDPVELDVPALNEGDTIGRGIGWANSTISKLLKASIMLAKFSAFGTFT